MAGHLANENLRCQTYNLLWLHVLHSKTTVKAEFHEIIMLD